MSNGIPYPGYIPEDSPVDVCSNCGDNKAMYCTYCHHKKINRLEIMVRILSEELCNHFCCYDYTQQRFNTFKEMAETVADSQLAKKEADEFHPMAQDLPAEF